MQGQAAYSHYLLVSNDEITIDAVKKVVGSQNAILYYPANISQSSHDTSVHYSVSYIDQGIVRSSPPEYKGVLNISTCIPYGKRFVKFTPDNSLRIPLDPPSLTGAQVTDDLIYEYLFDMSDTANTSNTSSTLNSKNNLTLFEKNLPLMKLAQAVLCANYKQVDYLLNKISQNTTLLQTYLTTPVTITDLQGRKHFKRTIYQLARGARDTDVIMKYSERHKKVVEGIAELLASYFDKLKNGDAMRLQQDRVQFPEGYEIKEKIRITNDSRELNFLLEIIDKTPETICQRIMALDSFHGYDIREDCYGMRTYKPHFPFEIYLRPHKKGLTICFITLDSMIKQKMISLRELKKIKVPHSVTLILESKEKYLPNLIDWIAADQPGNFYTIAHIHQLKRLSHAIVTATSNEAFESALRTLQKIINDIVTVPIDLTLLNALYRFRNYLHPKNLYTTGFHSNQQLLLEAMQLYKKNFTRFGDTRFAIKNIFCWQKVVGLTQRLIPSCEAQMLTQGFICLEQGEEKTRRSFSFNDLEDLILPLDGNISFRLGYNYAVEMGQRLLSPTSSNAHKRLEQLIMIKNLSAGKLLAPRNILTEENCCRIM